MDSMFPKVENAIEWQVVFWYKSDYQIMKSITAGWVAKISYSMLVAISGDVGKLTI